MRLAVVVLIPVAIAAGIYLIARSVRSEDTYVAENPSVEEYSPEYGGVYVY